jgi:hypothetical protein
MVCRVRSIDLAALLSLLGPARAPRVVREVPDQLGYTLAAEPLLAVMSRAEWEALEQSALGDRAP